MDLAFGTTVFGSATTLCGPESLALASRLLWHMSREGRRERKKLETFLKKRDFGVLFNGGRGRGEGSGWTPSLLACISPVRDDGFVYLCTTMGMCPQHRKKPATVVCALASSPSRRLSHVV